MKRKSIHGAMLFLSILILSLTGCGGSSSHNDHNGQAQASTQKAIIIGVDGLVYSYVDGVDDASINEPETPNFDRLTLSRAFTGGLLNTNTEQDTSSSPGWTSILTGTWVDQHGISGNNLIPTAVPSLFSRLNTLDSTIKTASYVHWSNINTGQLSEELGLMETHVEGVGDDIVTADVVTELEKASSDLGFVFVQLDDVDHAGHQCGWGSCYEEAVSIADEQLGKILDAIEDREELYNEEWLVIVVADHGHKPTGGHGGQTLEERTSLIGVNRPDLMNTLFSAPASALPLSEDTEQNELMGYPAVTSLAPTVIEYLGYPVSEDEHFAGTSLLNKLGAHKVYTTTEEAEDYTSATVTLHWQVGDDATGVNILRNGETIAEFAADQRTYQDILTAEDYGSDNFTVGYTVVADTGTPVTSYATGSMIPTADTADVAAKADLLVSFDDTPSPFSWVAGSSETAQFAEGPFAGADSIHLSRELGYGTYEKDFNNVTKYAVGFWLKVNAVSSDPNIISNKDWGSGYNKGFTVAVKSSGIKLNIGDGTNRADTSYMSYPANQWIYVAAAIDLENQTMTLYIYDTEKQLTSTTVATGDVSSLASDYPLNIGEGGDGDYNLNKTLDVNMADLIVIEGQEVTAGDIRALAKMDKPLRDDFISEVADNAVISASLNGDLAPLSWQADGNTEASFAQDSPFEDNTISSFTNNRPYGYASYNQDLSGLNQLAFGCWVKINAVSSDPNLISNKDWHAGTNKGFTVAVKSSGIKLNIADGTNRADTEWIPYTAGEWLYLAAFVDLDNATMTFYVVDPVNGISSASTDTGSVSSLASDYPVNIGEGGDGAYNLNTTLSFNMADLIFLARDKGLSAAEVQALSQASKPLSSYGGN